MKLTQTLIDVINRGDYETYARICDTEMSAIEPESFGNIVYGMPFHKFYFDNGKKKILQCLNFNHEFSALGHNSINNSMVSPIVHILGTDAACIAYVRLTQYLDK